MNLLITEITNELNKLFAQLNPEQKSIKVSFILSKLDFSIIRIDQRESTFDPYSLIKLYIYRQIKGFNYYEKVLDFLQKNESEALLLGFSRDENNQLRLPTKRAFNKFFQNKVNQEIKIQLDLIAKKIIQTASENKIVLDLEIIKRAIREYKDKKEDIKKKSKEAIKLVKKLIFPLVDLKIGKNGKFTTRDLLDVLVFIAFSHDFTTNGSNVFQELNSEKQIPSGDLMLHHFSKFKSINEIKEIFERIFDVIFNYTKQNYHLINIRKVNIAYDIHKIPFYGDKNNIFVVEGKPERGTSHFFQFLTCSIVLNGQRFVIDAIPISKLDKIHELLTESLIRVKQKVRIDKAFLDRGFDKPNIINCLKTHNTNFIMPKIRSKTVKAWMRKSEGCKSRFIPDFEIGRNEDKTIVNLYLVDDEDGVKRAFITNFHIPEQLAFYLYSMYSKRWGIETGYRQLDHDFKARTTTKNYHIRLFYFLFSVCLYNLWVLVNICVSIALYCRLKDKPIITAKLFAVILYKTAYDFDPP